MFVNKTKLEKLLRNIELKINKNVYLKNPESSKLGKLIIEGAVDLISEIGFEDFTFKKLSKEINSTEASVYRYFENKHKLLAYLTIWYYRWLEYRLIFKITNVEDPKERLRRAIILFTEEVEQDSSFSHINELKLSGIVIVESSKVYLNKNVDKDNSEGYFWAYKELVNRVSDIILEINPSYKYPHMLLSTVIEGAHHQRFFLEHLPKLTDSVEGEDSITSFYLDLVKNLI